MGDNKQQVINALRREREENARELRRLRRGSSPTGDASAVADSLVRRINEIDAELERL